MKITTTVHNLVDALRVTKRTASSTATSITSYVLLSAKDGTFTAMTTDITAATRIALGNVKIDQEGAVCLPAATLTSIVGALPFYDTVSISMDDDGRYKATIALTKGTYRATISGLAPDDMPSLPTMEDIKAQEGATVLKIRTPGLNHAIKQVATFSASEKAGRPQLAGVAVVFTQQAVSMMGCDGHRLAMRTIPVTGTLPETPEQLIMPTKGLKEFADLLSTADTAELAFPEGRNIIVFRVASSISTAWTEITSMLIAGPYPNLSAIIPRSHLTRAVVSRNDLSEALKPALVLAEKHKMITLELDPAAPGDKTGTLSLLVSNQLTGASEQALAANVTGTSNQIAFNGEFLKEWLDGVEQQTIVMEMTGPTLPALLYPNGVAASTYFYVMMPMHRPQDDEEETEKEEAKPAKTRGKSTPSAGEAPEIAPVEETGEASEIAEYDEDAVPV